MNVYFKIVGICLYFLQTFSYTYTFLINPGIPRKNSSINLNDINQSYKEGYKFCNQCRILMHLDTNTNHCDDCNVCIEGINI